MAMSAVVAGSAAMIVAGMISMVSCPNQNKTPPTVRIQWCSGATCGPLQSGNAHIDPNQPLIVFVDGFSSLSGMQSLEVDPDYSIQCSNGQVAQNVDVTTMPSKTTAASQTLRLSLEIDVGTPKDSWCKNSDIPFSTWSGSFSAKAISNNGLSATGQVSLQAP